MTDSAIIAKLRVLGPFQATESSNITRERSALLGQLGFNSADTFWALYPTAPRREPSKNEVYRLRYKLRKLGPEREGEHESTSKRRDELFSALGLYGTDRTSFDY